MFIAIISALLCATFANEANLITVNIKGGYQNIPKIKVYEFTDGRSNYFSTRRNQVDPRWKYVRDAFCVSGAADAAMTDFKPMDLWVKPYSAENLYDTFLPVEDDEMGIKGAVPRIGSGDKNSYGYFYLGRLGFVASKDLGGMVPLYRYWDNSRLHYFTVEQGKFPPGNASSTFRAEKYVAFVWKTC